MQYKTKVQIVNYRPQTNGLVERQNRSILEHLRHYVSSTSTNWDLQLPFVQMSINSAISSSIGDSPHFALFHFDKRLPFDLPNTAVEDVDYSEYHSGLAKRSIEIHEYFRRKLEETNKNMVDKSWAKRHSNRDIRIGDKCYIQAVKKPHESKKLYPKWDGPYRVIKNSSSP